MLKTKKSHKFFFGILVMLILLVPVYGLTIEAKIKVNEAYYTNLDTDGLEDDIVIKFSLEFKDPFDPDNTLDGNMILVFKFNLAFTLTLPSGLTHFFDQTIISSKSKLSGELDLYNSATESGWYNIKIELKFIGKVDGYASTNLDFDPPGHDDGGPPVEAILTIT